MTFFSLNLEKNHRPFFSAARAILHLGAYFEVSEFVDVPVEA